MHVERGWQQHPPHALLGASHSLGDARNITDVAYLDTPFGEAALRMPEPPLENHSAASGSSDSRSV